MSSDVKPDKACPVVIRESGGELSLLAFRHPLAGCQLVKGTIECETPSEAAVRELFEEAGVLASAERELGLWKSNHGSGVWSFHLCRPTAPLPDSWTHRCRDDGGHDFQFFWHPLRQDPSPEWHPVHARALAFIQGVLTTRSSGPCCLRLETGYG